MNRLGAALGLGAAALAGVGWVFKDLIRHQFSKPGWHITQTSEDEAHVWPCRDLEPHTIGEDDGDCHCRPVTIPVEREDGSIGWVYRHRSFDGREFEEA